MNSNLFYNINQLVIISESNTLLKKGSDLKNILILNNAWLQIKNSIVENYGTMDSCPTISQYDENCQGKIILPGFVDSHTHLVFAETREEEFVMKLKGVSYEVIAANGGGILNSAKKLATLDENYLFDSALERLNEILKTGTTTVEIKSGYGLTFDSEIKMLKVIQKLKTATPQKIYSTFLGAHTFPTEFKNNHQAYIDLIINKMLPTIADEGLADFADVFCEKGFFNPQETIQILEAAAKYNIKAKVHANELDFSGGVQAGVQVDAISVDHLECVGESEIEALLKSNTMPTLLPSTAFFLNLHYAPARKMIDAGLPVALATDYNPGTSPSGNMPLVISMACTQMKMLPEEAICAATLNGAFALGCSNEVGSLVVGKKADFLITKPINSINRIPYSFGSNLIEQVYIGGERV